MTPPILAIVGFSNAGKTTLMEKLIARLSDEGLRIGSIKHSHHQPEMDAAGKDSWRHKRAGAERSLLVGPERMMMVADLHREMNPEILVRYYCNDVDLVLVEGYASLPGAKIEVLRAACHSRLRCHPDELLAVVTDIDNVQPGLPRYGLDDIDALAGFVLKWMQQRCAHG